MNHEDFVHMYTVSPQQDATWLITEGGLSSEFTSQNLYGKNVP